jgi:hypothetical protein
MVPQRLHSIQSFGYTSFQTETLTGLRRNGPEGADAKRRNELIADCIASELRASCSQQLHCGRRSAGTIDPYGVFR